MMKTTSNHYDTVAAFIEKRPRAFRCNGYEEAR